MNHYILRNTVGIQTNLPSEITPEGESVEPVEISTGQALTNSVHVRLATGGVEFDFASQQTVSHELVELTAKLETAAEIIKDLSTRLAGALYLAGHLEAQLTAKDEEIRKLNEANKRWWKRFGMWTRGT